MGSPSLNSTSTWLIAATLTATVFGALFGIAKWVAEADLASEERDVQGESEAEIAVGQVSQATAGFAPKAASGPIWSYSGSSGPAYWGDLAESYALCRTGKAQSPINLTGAKLNSKLLPIRFHYRNSESVIKHEGSRLVMSVEAGNHVELEGDRFELKEIVFHAPSEHKVDDVPYDMELQLVHRSSTGQIAMISLLAEEGTVLKGLSPFWQDLPKKSGDIGPTHTWNPIVLIPRIQTYYSYTGSLTTPPCTEGIRWLVLTQEIEVSSSQVDQFLAVMRYNSRPTKSLGIRTLHRSRR